MPVSSSGEAYAVIGHAARALDQIRCKVIERVARIGIATNLKAASAQFAS